MKYTHLGKNRDLKISRIGMGVWQASDAWNADDNKVIDAIGHALHLALTSLTQRNSTATAIANWSLERLSRNMEGTIFSLRPRSTGITSGMTNSRGQQLPA